jgi:acyl-CoA dehydrogenase
MAWDFSTEPEFQERLDWVEEFCKDKVEPLDFVLPYAIRSPDPTVKAYVRSLQQEVKEQGLWAIFLDEELGGPGLGQLKLGLLNEIIGRYGSAPQMFGAAAPDTGNMEMLAAYGTDEQKKRWLEPLLNQDMFSAYSMTEPQGGSDPNLFKTHAMRDGDEWVINGEKWFTSAGRVADILFVMCTNGMFVVPRKTPGVEIMPEPRNHNHIIYRDVRVPLDHLLGPEDGAKVLAQRRLGGGRIHHAMRTIAQCNLAFDMMCERALSRESHGKTIAEHQMVQEKIAESYASIKMLRLLVLEAAWKIDQTSTQEARTEIAAVKFTMARVLREVSFNALHILGSLGTTDLTPLQAMYAGAPTMGIADGVDEVHMATVARRVLKGYRPHDGYFPTEFIPYKRQQAWKKMEPVFAANPDLRDSAERYKKYLEARRH